MPLFRKPTTEELEDHFFGSGAFMYGWFDTNGAHTFPVTLYDVTDNLVLPVIVTEEVFIEGIKKFAENHPTKTFDDCIEDMDAYDVDCVFQYILFGEIRYA